MPDRGAVSRGVHSLVENTGIGAEDPWLWPGGREQPAVPVDGGAAVGNVGTNGRPRRNRQQLWEQVTQTMAWPSSSGDRGTPGWTAHPAIKLQKMMLADDPEAFLNAFLKTTEVVG